MLVGREDGFVLSCQFIISLNCVFSVCVCESESVCVCIYIYSSSSGSSKSSSLLLFTVNRRGGIVVGMIREVCDSWQNPNRRCLAQQNSSWLATLIYSFVWGFCWDWGREVGSENLPILKVVKAWNVFLAENWNGMSWSQFAHVRFKSTGRGQTALSSLALFNA